MSTRTTKLGYKHEFDEAKHRALSKLLHEVKGMGIVSGYPSKLYNKLYRGWRCLSHRSNTTGGLRTEVLWLSPNCEKMASQQITFDFDISSSEN